MCVLDNRMNFLDVLRLKKMNKEKHINDTSCNISNW